MKKFLLLFLLCIPFVTFAAKEKPHLLFSSLIESSLSKITSTNVRSYIKENKTCTGVTEMQAVKDFEKFLDDEIGKKMTGEALEYIPKFGDITMFENFTEYAELYEEQKKVNDTYKVIQKIRKSYKEQDILKKIEASIVNNEACTVYIGQELEYCTAYSDYREGVSLFTSSKKTRFIYLEEKMGGGDIKNVFKNLVLQEVYKNIEKECKANFKGAVNQTLPVETKTKKIASISDSELIDLIKTLKEKYKLMNKSQKEKFKKAINEFK